MRILQNKETSHFKSIFKGKFLVYRGTYPSLPPSPSPAPSTINSATDTMQLWQIRDPQSPNTVNAIQAYKVYNDYYLII